MATHSLADISSAAQLNHEERFEESGQAALSIVDSAIVEAISAYPLLMTVEQVCEVLQMSQNAVRSLLNQRILPGKKLSHKWIIPREALAKALIET